MCGTNSTLTPMLNRCSPLPRPCARPRTAVGASSDGSGQHADAPHQVTTPSRQNSGTNHAVPNATVTISTYTTTNPISAATIELIRPIRSIVRQARYDPANAPIQITDPPKSEPTMLWWPNWCRTYGRQHALPDPIQRDQPDHQDRQHHRRCGARPANKLAYDSSQPRPARRIPATATGGAAVATRRERSRTRSPNCSNTSTASSTRPCANSHRGESGNDRRNNRTATAGSAPAANINRHDSYPPAHTTRRRPAPSTSHRGTR